MTDKKERPKCAHCNSEMLPWMAPAESSWGEIIQFVCFNDECSYYVRGWNHMWKNFSQKSSYRYRFNPQNGESGPLPVWSNEALKDRVML